LGYRLNPSLIVQPENQPSGKATTGTLATDRDAIHVEASWGGIL
jgi:hypothetical protein